MSDDEVRQAGAEVVAAVQEALYCDRAPEDWGQRDHPEAMAWIKAGSPLAASDVCWTHRKAWGPRGCWVAVTASDAAIKALGPFARIVKRDRVFEYIDDNPEVWVEDV